MSDTQEVLRLVSSAESLLKDARILIEGAKAILESDAIEYFQLEPEDAYDLASYQVKEMLECCIDDIERSIAELNKRKTEVSNKVADEELCPKRESAINQETER